MPQPIANIPYELRHITESLRRVDALPSVDVDHERRKETGRATSRNGEATRKLAAHHRRGAGDRNAVGDRRAADHW